jgi:dynein heavy chain
MVVRVEKPDLEQTKEELVNKQNEFKITLAQLETNLLNQLSEADPATILQNTELINSLEETKKTSTEIKEQQELAKVTEKNINTLREVYRRVSAEGAMLYFMLITLSFIIQCTNTLLSLSPLSSSRPLRRLRCSMMRNTELLLSDQ